MNRAYLLGTIGADVELRASLSGATLASVSLAVPNVRTVDGVSIDVPDWHRLTAHGDVALHLASVGRKGARLGVEATIRPVKWQDARGNVHRDLQLHIERVISVSQ